MTAPESGFTATGEMNDDSAREDKSVTVTFSGYSPSGTAAEKYTLSVQPASVTANIAAKTITLTVPDIAAQTYTGAQITPQMTVSSDGVVNGYMIVSETDYTVTYRNNTGNVTISPVSTSNYTFTAATKTFAVGKADPIYTAPSP